MASQSDTVWCNRSHSVHLAARASWLRHFLLKAPVDALEIGGFYCDCCYKPFVTLLLGFGFMNTIGLLFDFGYKPFACFIYLIPDTRDSRPNLSCAICRARVAFKSRNLSCAIFNAWSRRAANSPEKSNIARPLPCTGLAGGRT